MLSVAISNEAKVVVEYHNGVANVADVPPHMKVTEFPIPAVGSVQDAWYATLLVFT